LVAYGARLESVLGASPHGFESHILRAVRNNSFTNETVKKPQRNLGLLSLVDYFGIRVF
ncbi:MAG: hypothetical protein RJA35_594, partial [Actinomycetota bacterium]